MNKKLYSLFLISLVLVIFSNLNCLSTANANTSQNKSNKNTVENASVTNTKLDDMQKIINQFTYRDDDLGVYFDLTAAKKANASADVLAIGKEINYINENNKNLEKAITENSTSSSTSEVRNRSLSIPVWGNWCGPGHGGGTPKDKLDSLCKTHDQCYGSRGYFACSCDKNLVGRISSNFKYMKIKERVAALAVKTYFEHAPCNPFK